ncbi:hypothetical protein BDV25DRAFT_157687 [Aspergillus avenaceus]|uniref:Uncharacterized protein n=1 Tax=Aspergillus avenaceus TaxID=36643 RepID=A0A5N6TR38_ASPAV|nr:hypothetical protein BDV25DRAFT_157687 [Aspergillus avenaceus]
MLPGGGRRAQGQMIGVIISIGINLQVVSAASIRAIVNIGAFLRGGGDIVGLVLFLLGVLGSGMLISGGGYAGARPDVCRWMG